MASTSLEQLEQVVHGGVGPQVWQAAHAQISHTRPGIVVNQHQLLHQNDTQNLLPTACKQPEPCCQKSQYKYNVPGMVTMGETDFDPSARSKSVKDAPKNVDKGRQQS